MTVPPNVVTVAKMKKRLLFCLLFTVHCLLFTGCDMRGVDPVLKIGLVAPFEGEQREIGYGVLYSARLAVREINAAGGVGGYRLNLVAFDDSTYPSEAQSVAEALIVDPDVIAVLGHWQSQTNAAAQPLYTTANMPFVPLLDNMTYDPATLPSEFAQAYQAVTFQGGRPPNAHSAHAYDAMQLIIAAIEKAADNGDVTRRDVAVALATVEIAGLTGTMSRP